MTTTHLVNIILSLNILFLAVLTFAVLDSAIFEYKRHRRESNNDRRRPRRYEKEDRD